MGVEVSQVWTWAFLAQVVVLEWLVVEVAMGKQVVVEHGRSAIGCRGRGYPGGGSLAHGCPGLSEKKTGQTGSAITGMAGWSC